MYTVSATKYRDGVLIHAHGRAKVAVLSLSEEWILRLSSVDLGNMSVYAFVEGEEVVEFTVIGDPYRHPHADSDDGRVCIGTYPTVPGDVMQCIWDYFNGSGVNPFDCYRLDMFRRAYCDHCDIYVVSVIPVMCVDPELVADVAMNGSLDYEQVASNYIRCLINNHGNWIYSWRIGGYHAESDSVSCAECIQEEG